MPPETMEPQRLVAWRGLFCSGGAPLLLLILLGCGLGLREAFLALLCFDPDGCCGLDPTLFPNHHQGCAGGLGAGCKVEHQGLPRTRSYHHRRVG